jgi:DNA adenine methylase
MDGDIVETVSQIGDLWSPLHKARAARKGPAVKPNPLVRPFLKWAGGKRQLLPELIKHLPQHYGTYYEPFLGGGALFLALQRTRAVVNDKNAELINCYEVVRDAVEELIAALSQHRNEEAYYYEVRDWDKLPDFASRSAIERAARIIFLNKTCYNGLFRVNSQGQFNVPFGRYAAPTIVDAAVLRAVSKYLRSEGIRILNLDFCEATREAKRGDFIYFDPPYDPVSDTASFTGYDVNGFGRDEQIRLKELVDQLTKRGCTVLLSNAATDFITELYRGYRQVRVAAARAINSNGQKRGKVDEILVMNYDSCPEARRASCLSRGIN